MKYVYVTHQSIEKVLNNYKKSNNCQYTFRKTIINSNIQNLQIIDIKKIDCVIGDEDINNNPKKTYIEYYFIILENFVYDSIIFINNLTTFLNNINIKINENEINYINSNNIIDHYTKEFKDTMKKYSSYKKICSPRMDYIMNEFNENECNTYKNII